jgi:hypothetical protein
MLGCQAGVSTDLIEQASNHVRALHEEELMPKRPKAEDPTFLLTSRIPRPIGSGPLPRDLPAAAWARLFAVALSRLHRARPGWASVTAVQVDNLLASWLVFVQDRSLSPPELDLRLEEVLEHLEAHPPWAMKARGRTADSPRGRRHKKGSRK